MRSLARFAFTWTILQFAIECSSAIAAPDRPVIVVPGILGTKLCQGKEVVWGGAKSLINFGRLDLAAGQPEDLQLCGLLDQVTVLGPFWKIEAYSNLIQGLSALGYVEGRNLFVYEYDWRKSNIENAALLKDFVDKISDSKVDIVAHSMGGLVTSIYVHKFNGTSRVNKIVFLGTPFLGSMNAFTTLSEGWGNFANMIAGGIGTIRQTALSFTSLYELMPSYDNCCRIGTKDDYMAIDPLDPAIWRMLEWLPTEYKSGDRKKFFEDSIAKAWEVRQLMKLPIPPAIKVSRVVGDVFGTNLYLVAPKTDPSWKNWTFVKARGDGTVPAWSAAGSMASLEGTAPSFNEHATIFSDRGVRSVLERELIAVQIPKDNRKRALRTTNGMQKNIDFIAISLDSAAVPIGGQTYLRMKVRWETAGTKGEYIPRAVIEGPVQDLNIPFTEDTTNDDLQDRSLSFAGIVSAPLKPGLWRIQFDFGELDSDYSTLLTVYSP
jgi:pimeloyl-ACP methyl ester carboxylesterase